MRSLPWMVALPLLLATSLALSTETDLTGLYGHDSTEPADEPVWQVERVGDDYSIEHLAVGEREPAWQLDGVGRAAFWDRMDWPVATATDAQCLSWGVAPTTLADLLAMPDDAAPTAKPVSSPAQTPGAGVFCRVGPASRAKISWLSDYHSDYFFYDSFVGVMEASRLPDHAAPLPSVAAP